MAPSIRPWALVTGASGGLGEALAHEAAKDGNNVVLVARNGDKLEEIGCNIRAAHLVEVKPLIGDLVEPADIDALQNTLSEDGIDVEILINNAGFGLHGAMADIGHGDQLEMIDLNIRAVTDLTRRFLPAMLRRRSGGVLNVASTTAFQPGPRMAVYFATKAYVKSLSEALWSETQEANVTVTALCPGPIRTDFFKRAGEFRLARNAPMMPPEKVAQIGYKAFKKKKRVIVPGLFNKAGVAFAQTAPRRLILSAVKSALK